MKSFGKMYSLLFLILLFGENSSNPGASKLGKIHTNCSCSFILIYSRKDVEYYEVSQCGPPSVIDSLKSSAEFYLEIPCDSPEVLTDSWSWNATIQGKTTKLKITDLNIFARIMSRMNIKIIVIQTKLTRNKF